MRRKRYYTRLFKTLDEAFEYLKRVKELNGNSIEVELSEVLGEYCCVVWGIR